jgi:hypothetical protein
MSSIVIGAGNDGRNDEAERIERHGDVTGYFHERVVAAMRERRVETAADTEFYLVKILSDAHGASDPEAPSTLVELYARATAASGRARILALRTLGDRALYLAGFFDDYLERRGLSRRYFAQMGEAAYDAACVLSARSEHIMDRARAPVFRELGERFLAFADVFVEVRESTSMRTADEVLELYRRFERTRSPTLAARLGRHGVYPGRGDGSGQLH